MKPKIPEEIEAGYNKVDGIMNALDRSYLEGWAGQTGRWTDLELYGQASSLLEPGLNSGSTHVDLGCGFGNFLALLKKKCPESLLYGVDVNAEMLFQAAIRIGKENLNFNLAICKGLSYKSSDDTLDRTPLYHESFKGVDFQNSDKIQLICDDIRSMGVLKQILSGRKIDSGSFLMPGISTSAALESPYHFDTVDTEVCKSRIGEVMEKVRGSAYLFMAEHLKEKGRMVIGERIAVLRGAEVICTATSFAKKMGDSGQYFDFENFVFLKRELNEEFMADPEKWKAILTGNIVDSRDSSISLMTGCDQETKDQLSNGDSRMTAFLCLLTRNDRPFPKGRLPG